MKQLIAGVIVGCLLTAVAVQATNDSLGRSPQQQKYDYFRERQQQLDIESIRKNQDNERLRNLGKSNPC